MNAPTPPSALRRFYKEAATVPVGEGFAVTLDGRRLRTPARREVVLPSLALAEAVASEWAGQGETIDLSAMPLTRLANVVIDRAAVARAAMVAEVVKYAGTDLVCHRADAPAALAARQAAAWDPLLAWAKDELGAPLAAAAGVSALDQPERSLAALAAAAEALDPWRLTALAHAVGLTGSAIIAFAIARGRLDAAGAFKSAFLDELWQLERWGEDAEARARLTRMEAELSALERWFAAI